MSTTSSHSNDSSIQPSSSREWFELILPLIDVPASEATADDLRSIAKTHAHRVIARVDEFDFSVDSIDWIASSRLKTAHGRCSRSAHWKTVDGHVGPPEFTSKWLGRYDEYSSS